MIIEVGILLLGISLVPYLYYYYGITVGRTLPPALALQEYPAISIVISAYNESANVEKRITNLAQCEYPGEVEVVFVDDCSEDSTKQLAQYYLDNYFFDYQLLINRIRMGTTKSYTKAINTATNNIIVVTDADVVFKPNALTKIINRLMSNEKIAAVTGDIQTRSTNTTIDELEGYYRSVYGKMCEWESVYDSTFNFNGALLAFKKDIITRVTDVGADDANIAFTAIRMGYRAVYERESVVYETLPTSFTVAYKQKIRRATLLMNSVISNRDILTKNRFYFLRAWMIFLSPIMFVLGSILSGLIIIIIPLMFRSTSIGAFVLNQFYLLFGAMNLGTDVRTWGTDR